MVCYSQRPIFYSKPCTALGVHHWFRVSGAGLLLTFPWRFVPYLQYKTANFMKSRQSLSEMNWARPAQPLAHATCLCDSVHSTCEWMEGRTPSGSLLPCSRAAVSLGFMLALCPPSLSEKPSIISSPNRSLFQMHTQSSSSPTLAPVSPWVTFGICMLSTWKPGMGAGTATLY